MSETTKVETENLKDILITCSRCNSKTYHKVLSRVSSEDSTEDETIWDTYRTIQCNGCRTFSFSHLSWSTLDTDENNYLISSEKTYPSRIIGQSILWGVDVLPESIYKIYKETYLALCNELPILASIGIRATLEAVCNDKNATGHNLVKKIELLALMGIITISAIDILNKLRLSGNDAAHEVKVYSNQWC